jgi:hypothetical protein
LTAEAVPRRAGGQARDCATRAIAIATERSYQNGYHALAAAGAQEEKALHRNHPRTGLRKQTVKNYLRELRWYRTAPMRIGSARASRWPA